MPASARMSKNEPDSRAFLLSFSGPSFDFLFAVSCLVRRRCHSPSPSPPARLARARARDDSTFWPTERCMIEPLTSMPCMFLLLAIKISVNKIRSHACSDLISAAPAPVRCQQSAARSDAETSKSRFLKSVMKTTTTLTVILLLIVPRD